jgi:hypothetical protein
MVSAEQIGVVLCDKDTNSYEVLTNIEQSEMDQDEFEDATDATRTMLASLTQKDFTANRQTARVHEFDFDGIEEDSDHPVRSLLESLRNGSDFESYIGLLAERYLNTDYSQSGILIIIRFSIDGHQQLGIVKAPFSVGYEPDDEVGLSQLDEIIEEELKKGSVYPRVKYSTGEERLDEVGIYQRSWAAHWWKFHGLTETKTEDELLHDLAVSDVEEGEAGPLADVESVDEFDDLRRTLDDEELAGEVAISIAGVTINVTLRDLVERNIFLVEDDGYYVVLSGNEPTISIKNPSGAEYRTEVMENLTEYDSFDDIA